MPLIAQIRIPILEAVECSSHYFTYTQSFYRLWLTVDLLTDVNIG